MKRILFLSLFSLLIATNVALAAPAYPFPVMVKQPDGTLKQVLLHGDEHHNWMTTLDGTLLHSSTPPLLHSSTPEYSPSVFGTSYFPHHGTPRVLVILAAYPDQDFTLPDPRKSFDQCLNSFGPQEDYGNGESRNICSVAEYFTTVSYGDYTPLFDVVGPVTLPDNMATYGTTNNLTKLCKDACIKLLEAQPEFDFTPYDNDNDGRVDMIYIVHAGYGENMGGSEDTMWARCGTVNASVGNTTVVLSGCHSELAFNEGTTQDSFGGIPQINGTGVLIHEFSHGMGLPDIYSTQTAAQQTNNQSMQRFDVMDVGCYNGNSWAPAPYNAWEQEAMGWLTIEELDAPLTGLTLTPILEGGTAYKIQNPLDENEYIILENIQKRGINSGAYSHGLLAYHFAYAKQTINMGDAPNNTVGSPRVAVIPAGGLLISSYLSGTNRDYTQQQYKESHLAATFPGSKNITTLTDEQALPNFRFYTTADESGLVGHSLYNIAETSDGTVTLDYDEDSTTGISTLTTHPSPLTSKYYTLDGRTVNGLPTQKGIYIYQGKKVIVR